MFANLGTGLSFCRASLGLLDEADRAGEEAVADAEKYGSPALISMARAGLMIAAQGRNDPPLLARRFAELAGTPLPEFGWWRRAVLTTRTRASAVLGQPEPCPELLGEPRDAMASLRYADAAVVAAAQRDPDTASTFIAEGLAIADEQGQLGQRAMILTAQAELMLRAHRPFEAGNLFRTARSIFRQRGMRLQLGRAQAGLAQAEAQLSRLAEPLAQLTAREREVAELLARGLRNREIAVQLTLSTSTAENHVRKVLKKLGLRRRGEVAGLLADRGAPEAG